MEYFLFIIVVSIVTFYVSQPITTLLHELGHAIPALIFTKKRVIIYIGSYSNSNKSFKINLNLLIVIINYKFYPYRRGMCKYSTEKLNKFQKIVILISGPLTTFIIAFFCFYHAINFDYHGLIKIILLIFLCLSIYELFINLDISYNPILTNEGKVLYSDGFQLYFLINHNKIISQYDKALLFFNQKNYIEAANSLEILIDMHLVDEYIYKLTMNSFIQANNYNKALNLYERYIKVYKMDSDDYANLGFIYSQLNKNKEAIGSYEKSLEINQNNIYSLNNIGFSLILENKFEESISYFNKAIEIDRTFANPYNNRGLAKIKIGNVEEGLIDIETSISLDEKNSYSWRNLGIYHFDKGEYLDALKLYKKARELDSSTHMIEDLIKEVEIKLL